MTDTTVAVKPSTVLRAFENTYQSNRILPPNFRWENPQASPSAAIETAARSTNIVKSSVGNWCFDNKAYCDFLSQTCTKQKLLILAVQGLLFSKQDKASAMISTFLRASLATPALRCTISEQTVGSVSWQNRKQRTQLMLENKLKTFLLPVK